MNDCPFGLSIFVLFPGHTSSEEVDDAMPFLSFLFGSNDVDRRSDLRASNLGNEFLGKRSAGATVKRRPGSEFLGEN